MSSTEQVVAAIQASSYRRNSLPIEAVASLPVPTLEEGKVLLAFFWCSVGGPIQNRTISAPYCRTLAAPDALGDIRFLPVQPRDLGIPLPRNAPLGKPTIGGSVPAAEMKQVRADFYQVTDRIMETYARAATSPNAFPDESERAEMIAYRAAFRRLAVVVLLPAYRALSPHFFAWMDAVLGPQPGL